MRRASLAVSLAGALSLVAGPVPAAEPGDRIRYDAPTSLPLTLGATALWIGTEFPLKRALAPDSCRWCDRDDQGRERLNALDASMRDRLRWDDVDAPRRVSDALLFAGVPAVAMGGMWLAARHDGREDEFGENAVMMFEAVAVSMTLNQAAKFLLARQRPYIHFARHGPASRLPDSDDNLSFYSGHAAVTLSLAAASGTIASLRGYRRGAMAWVPSAILATTTGYLRIACDRHYFTDVLAGLGVGAAVGLALPRAMHERDLAGGEESGGAARSIPVAVVRWRW